MRKLSFRGFAALVIGAVLLGGSLISATPAAAQCAMWCPCGTDNPPPYCPSGVVEGFFKLASKGARTLPAETPKKSRPAKRL